MTFEPDYHLLIETRSHQKFDVGILVLDIIPDHGDGLRTHDDSLLETEQQLTPRNLIDYRIQIESISPGKG